MIGVTVDTILAKPVERDASPMSGDEIWLSVWRCGYLKFRFGVFYVHTKTFVGFSHDEITLTS